MCSSDLGATNTAALRRTSGTAATVPANYATTSNNNLFYAGTPGSNNLLYTEGTVTTFTNSMQTLADLRTFMVNRDQASVTENPTFISTTGSNASFLHINTSIATQIESGALPAGSVTLDFDGDTRNVSTPDIGADEGNFVLADVTPPTITYTT